MEFTADGTIRIGAIGGSEEGKFEIKDGKITTSETDGSNTEEATYKIEGDELTITYEDGQEFKLKRHKD